MVNGKQQFIATVNNMHQAAMIYDIVQIQQKGVKRIRTNFDYTVLDVLAIAMLGSILDFLKL